MNKKTELTSGQYIDLSGQYKIKYGNGKLSKNESTFVEGKRTPPTPKPNQSYILVDKTKHKK